MKAKSLLLISSLALFFSFQGKSQTLTTKNVITGLDTPWEILWGPDNYIWMTERAGKVSRVNPNDGTQEVLITIPGVTEQSESGLLGMALHPDFSNSPHVYLAYTYLKNSKITEKIVRYEYANNKLQNEVVLLDDIPGFQNHDGCRLVFGPDGKLFISTGDAGNASLAQNRNSINGKILRMNADGSIPSDNPFGNSYVWATGSRNSQGLVWANGKLYGSEHGANSNDEINIYQGGRNFGWPNVEGFCDLQSEQQFCTDSNVVEPLYAWTPTLAVCGIDYYPSNISPNELWNNSLIMTTLKDATLYVLNLNEAGTEITTLHKFFNKEFGRLRDVCVSPEGRVFIATSNRDGRGNPAANDDRILEIKNLVNIKEESHIYRSPKMLQNPVKDYVLLEDIQRNTNLEIFDLTGKRIYSGKANQPNTKIDCKNWPKGIYVLKCSNGGFISTQKVVVAE